MADYTPVFVAAPPVTLQASATITGGNLVAISGSGTVAHAGAASAAFIGVAAHDAVNGQKVAVYAASGNVHETVTAAGVTAGNHLKTVAAGAGVDPTPATYDVDVGMAITTATAGNVTRWIAT